MSGKVVNFVKENCVILRVIRNHNERNRPAVDQQETSDETAR